MRTPEVEVALDTGALHDMVHAAVHAQYDSQTGWWSDPLETALIAVADARHAAGSRRMAETAYERLSGWLNSDEPRSLGDDAAAAALTARAALTLQGGSESVTTRAVDLVSSACGGNNLALAPLHVALSAWALDPVVVDRHRKPWDDIRGCLNQFSTTGVNGAFVQFIRTLADQSRPHFDARAAEAVPLDRTEECLLLWLLDASVGVELARGDGSGTPAEALLRRRTELLDRLSSELTPEHLMPAVYADYNPELDDEVRPDGLGLFEACLLDMVLSGGRPQQALISLAEADQLAAASSRYQRRALAVVAAVVALVISGLGSAVAALARGGNAHIAVGVGFTVLCAGLVVALQSLRSGDTPWDTQKLMTALLGETLLGVFLIVEGAWKVLVGDDVAAILGIAAIGLTFLLDAAAARLQKK
jgi:hypothetical protein